MANLTETNTYESGIYQLETIDRVVGGADGTANVQAKQLANRTKYLKAEVEKRTVATDLASTATGKGATLVGVKDAGGFYAGATVEDALQEAAVSSTTKHTPAGANPTVVTVQDELRTIDGSLPDLTQDLAMLTQPLNYLKDSIGLGYANGDIHINGNLQLGAIRNALSYTNDLTWVSVLGATKDTTKSINYRGITLQRAYGSGFYASIYSNLAGTNVALTSGKKYLASCYVINLSDQEKFIWQRSLPTNGDYGHGAKLVDRNVRRIWQLVQATSSTAVDLMANPTVALGSGTGNGSPSWLALNRSDESFDVRIGGFQLEQVPDDAKAGVAVIGDSTVAGGSGKLDLASSTEWTRWAEAQLNVPFFNRGVGGETTAAMRARWSADMTPLAVNANYAIIQGGINDISQGRTLADIKTDIQWMHDQAITDGMQPIVCTCTPTSSIQADSTKESDRQALNTWIKQTFALILDLDKVVRDPSNPSLLRQKSGWVGDGVHFDAQAKRAIGIYVAKWPFWNFITPSPYQERTGNAALVDPVRAGNLFHQGSGYSNISVAGTGSINLKNDSRLTAQVLELSGALTGIRTVYFQGFIPKLWFVRNTTSGAFALTVNGVDSSFAAIGSGVTIGQGKGAWILSTGAGLVRASADV